LLSESKSPQDNTLSTYAKKLTKSESWINWQQSATIINQQIRGFNPYPIAQTYAKTSQFDKKILRILSAKVIKETHTQPAGSLIKQDKNTCWIATGKAILSLEQVQLAGKKPISIQDFNNAYQLLSVS
jgi:methionyl-tRNA formyltransferase